MAKSIDNRVVEASFENSKFQTNIAATIKSLQTLDATLRKVGTVNGLSNIEAAANKVDFAPLTKAINTVTQDLQLKGSTDGLNKIQQAASKINFSPVKTALSAISGGATTAFSAVSNAASKVSFLGLSRNIQSVNEQLNFGKTADTAFAEVENASEKVDFSGFGNAITTVGLKLGKMQTIATTALGTIVSRATSAGINIVKSFTIDPVSAGFESYETQINAVQTILANTGLKGKKGIDTVNASLKELQIYANKTVYNFSEMAKNIGTFTAAGVKLKPATAAIKGIANLAALSGSSSEQASTAMYQLSQAIASNKVGLQDWNSVVNAGLGGKVFQKALFNTAEQMHTIKTTKLNETFDEWTKSGNSFRNSLKDGWITGKVLTNTLSQFTGDLSDAQLKSQGYNAAQIKQIQALGKTANDAATKIKTFSQLTQALKEEVATAFGQVFKTIFGDIKPATALFSSIHTAVENGLTNPIYAFNKVLEDTFKMGGKKHLLDGFKNALGDVNAIIKPIKSAFREIFPKETAGGLLSLIKSFESLTKSLKVGDDTAKNIKRTFAGVFAVFDIGIQVVKQIFGVFGDLFKSSQKGAGGILGLTGNIGDMLVALDKAIKNGKGLDNFFNGLGKILAIPIHLIGILVTALDSLFDGGSTKKAGKALGGITDELSPMGKVLKVISSAWDGFTKSIDAAYDHAGPVVHKIAGIFGTFGDQVADGFKHADYSKVFDALQTTLIGGIALTLKKALGGNKGLFNFKFGGAGALDAMKESLEGVTGSLKAMETQIKAKTLLLIAGAIATLAAGILVLSSIDPAKLTKAMTGVAVGMGELVGAMKALSLIGGKGGFLKLPVMASGLILVAGAVDLLSIAVFAFSRLDWQQLTKGLAGVLGSLIAINAGTRGMGPQLALVGPALIPIAISLSLIAGAVRLFATMNWSQMAKGLAGVLGSLVAINAGTKGMGPELILIGPGLIAVGAALTIIAGAMKVFATMKWEDIGKGLTGIAASLVVIGLAIDTIPPTVALQAAGLTVLGIALASIAGDIRLMGGMDIGTLAKGIGALGAAIVVLGVSLIAMDGALPGAAALAVTAVGLDALVPALGIMGHMKFSVILKGIGGIALAIVAIGAAGTVAGPGLLIVSAGILAIGTAVALIGSGIYLLTKGLQQMGSNGTKAVAVLIASFTALAIAIPKVITDFLKGLVDTLAAVAALAPKLAVSIGIIIDEALAVVISASPKMAQAFIALIDAGLTVLNAKGPALVQAGFTILEDLLGGIANNIGKVTVQVADIITHFLTAIAKKLPALIDSGAKAIGAFVDGLARNIGTIIGPAAHLITNFLNEITKHIPDIVASAARLVAKFVGSIADHLGELVDAGAKFVVKLLDGIGSKLDDVAAAAVRLAKHFLNALADALVGMAKAGADAVVKFLNGVADAIRSKSKPLAEAGANVGEAIIQGIITGMVAIVPHLLSKVGDIAGSVIKKFGKVWKVFSPSRVMHEMGGYLLTGLTDGMGAGKKDSDAISEKIAQSVVDKFKNVLQIASPSKVMQEIGRSTLDGFVKGLTGNSSDISSAFKTLEGKITDASTTLQNKITSEQKSIDAKRAVKKPDWDAIQAAEKALDKDKDNLSVLNAAHKELTSTLSKQKAELQTLANQYSTVTTKLSTATDALTTAKQALTDAKSQFSDEFDALPTLADATDENGAPVDQLGKYTKSLTDQVAAVEKYQATLDQLAALGLDAQTYQKLVTDGTVDQSFASALLAGGTTAVSGINALDKQLKSASDVLADHASTQLYQVGVNMAQSIVDGLKKDQAKIVKQMEDLADAITKAVKKKLGIKSPSKVFTEIGKNISQGMTNGLRSSSSLVADAASSLGDDALSAVQKTVAAIHSAVSDNIDASPTITPVLDLSQVQEQAKQLSDLSNVIPITAAASYGQAGSIATDVAANQVAADAAATPAVTTVEFNQTNTSPEALSTTEIYRQTNNQLSQAKKALGL